MVRWGTCGDEKLFFCIWDQGLSLGGKTIIIPIFRFFNIGATGFEGVGEDCRYLAVVTLYPDKKKKKKFAELRETLYLCGVKNKDSQNK